MKIITNDPFAGYTTVKIRNKIYNRAVRKKGNRAFIIINNKKIMLTKKQWPYR